MKRFALVVFAMAVAPAALAFNPTVAGGNRIGILNTIADEEDLETLRVAGMIRGHLARELRKEGFEVFDVRATLDEVLESGRADADYFVEFLRGDSSESFYGGIGVGGRRAGVDLELGRAFMAARIRIYDGQTLDTIDEIFVEASGRNVMPVSIGIGGRHGGFSLGVPVGLLRNRAVAKQAARDAAQSIAAILEGEAHDR